MVLPYFLPADGRTLGERHVSYFYARIVTEFCSLCLPHRQLALLLRLVRFRIFLKSEVTIRKAHAHDRATEPGIVGALEVKAWLHNGVGKRCAHTLAVRAQSANRHRAVTS
jgi:hypothetical protein